ncbi:MAG: alanine--tRNA ligase [Clostridia bacterium]|nr:alanine--tRNA ligase [Clostridia bacterium]
MKRLSVNEIRKAFLDFFKQKDHLILPSFSLIPENDKSLLLVNAGMAPLKPYFTGQKKPPSKRIATCQKCVRTPDIERVGITARHATFFEMLGNFSFGDYFKEEAITWAWEFVTEWLEMPEDRIWISIYQNDDEAFDIWHNKIGIPKKRIVRLGKEDNFWEIGQGPCGPCSELHFDRGEKYGCGKPDCTVGCDCDRFVEFWNLVFTQFDKDENGNYNKLKNPNIDTGMGLERMAVILQDVDSIFDIDSTRDIINRVCKITGHEYGHNEHTDKSIRVVADHIRGAVFMISDGILPSNEGRGYVLRRIIRRAARHGKLLGIDELFLSQLSDVIIHDYSDAYPELDQRKNFIEKVIRQEEERFQTTIDQGIHILNSFIKELEQKSADILPGEQAFKLYDTYGFPLDLTKEILQENNMQVDEKAFESMMANQKRMARAAREKTEYINKEERIFTKIDKTVKSKFVGYEHDKIESQILYIIKKDGLVKSADIDEDVGLILDKTPFYPEAGGQLADIGILECNGNIVNIKDVKRVDENIIVHYGRIKSGHIHVDQKVVASIDFDNRLNTARNHTSTHLLHRALRDVLGAHVEQSGSLVSPEKLRFDFTHFEPLNKEQIDSVEAIVNDAIFGSLKVNTLQMSYDDAVKMGAIALFDQKYGDKVRVVNIEDYSIELCGGTHLSNTSQAGLFKIISETGVASGIRRIEAVTGKYALDYMKSREKTLVRISDKLKVNVNDVEKRIDALIETTKNLEKEVEKLKGKFVRDRSDELINSANQIKGIKVVARKVGSMDINSMRNFADNIRSKMENCLVVLAAQNGERVSWVAMADKSAVNQGINCSNIIKKLANITGGGGGGRPDMAQAGGKKPEKIDDAISQIESIIKQEL